MHHDDPKSPYLIIVPQLYQISVPFGEALVTAAALCNLHIHNLHTLENEAFYKDPTLGISIGSNSWREATGSEHDRPRHFPFLYKGLSL